MTAASIVQTTWSKLIFALTFTQAKNIKSRRKRERGTRVSSNPPRSCFTAAAWEGIVSHTRDGNGKDLSSSVCVLWSHCYTFGANKSQKFLMRDSVGTTVSRAKVVEVQFSSTCTKIPAYYVGDDGFFS